MKESNISDIRILQPGIDGYMGEVAITCKVNGIEQEPRFLALGEYFAWNGAKDNEKQRIERNLAERYFSIAPNRPKVIIEDIHILLPGYEARTSNAGIRCMINGVQQKAKPLTPMAYHAWTTADKHERITLEQRLAESAYRLEIRSILRNSSKTAPFIVSTSTDLHEAQLKAMLKQVGYQLDERFLEQLRKSPETTVNYDRNRNPIYIYKRLDLVAEDNVVKRKASMEDVAEYNGLSVTLGLAQKLVSDIKVMDIHPETGERLMDDTGYISCCINDVPQQPKHFGQDVFDRLKQGKVADFQLAASMYRNEIAETQAVQVVQVDTGYRIEDGKQVLFNGGNSGDGYIYKDSEAFRKKEGICYIDEDSLMSYEYDRSMDSDEPISHYGVNYKAILDEARSMGFKEPEKMAEYAFNTAKWESIYTRLNEIHEVCDESELMDVHEKIKAQMDWFVEDKGQLPNYAQVLVQFKEDGQIQGVNIALNEKAGAYADDEVMFTCSNADEFMRLSNKDNGEDFQIIELTGYSLGDDPQKIAEMPDVLLDINDNAVMAIARENDWEQDMYVTVVHHDGTGHGFYVTPEDKIYDSTAGLDGQNFSELIGKALAQQIRQMGEFHKLNLQDGSIESQKPIQKVIVKQVGEGMFSSGRIRCVVHGEQQTWKNLTFRDWREYQKLPSEKAKTEMAELLANKYFAEEVKNSREQQMNGGLKR